MARKRPKSTKAPKARKRPTKAVKARKRPTKAVKARKRPTKAVKARKRPTKAVKARKRPTKATKARKRSRGPARAPRGASIPALVRYCLARRSLRDFVRRVVLSVKRLAAAFVRPKARIRRTGVLLPYVVYLRGIVSPREFLEGLPEVRAVALAASTLAQALVAAGLPWATRTAPANNETDHCRWWFSVFARHALTTPIKSAKVIRAKPTYQIAEHSQGFLLELPRMALVADGWIVALGNLYQGADSEVFAFRFHGACTR